MIEVVRSMFSCDPGKEKSHINVINHRFNDKFRGSPEAEVRECSLFSVSLLFTVGLFTHSLFIPRGQINCVLVRMYYKRNLFVMN